MPGRDSDGARPVVVGVDGSQGSARALAWALREARDRHAPVRVITAWAWGGSGLRPANGRLTAPMDVARHARHTQEALVRAVLAGFPGPLPQLTTELVQGDPASALIERSRDAVLLVLGNQGLTGDCGQAVGSVADACLRHGGCPVVVVPPRPVGVAEPAHAGRSDRAGLAPAVLGAIGLL